VRALPTLLLVVLLTGCGERPDESGAAAPRPVKTVPVRPAEHAAARLSGTVRARFETPLAFQVDGRIVKRHVDAGQRVAGDTLLFELDRRDFRQRVRVARAELEAARAELATAEAETRRNRDLLAREFISQQVFDRVALAERSARERTQAAEARLEQAAIALDYTHLAAGRDGILIDVAGEPGQVVAAGEPVAVLALDGRREIEVELPGRIGVPERGRARTATGGAFAIALREVAGAADPVSRTWMARYAIEAPAAEPRLGSVVTVALDAGGAAGTVLEVPVGAVNERGAGPAVWVVVGGRVRPVPVQLVDLDTEQARIRAELPDDARVVALGTHLLEDGMAVREID